MRNLSHFDSCAQELEGGAGDPAKALGGNRVRLRLRDFGGREGFVPGELSHLHLGCILSLRWVSVSPWFLSGEHAGRALVAIEVSIGGL